MLARRQASSQQVPGVNSISQEVLAGTPESLAGHTQEDPLQTGLYQPRLRPPPQGRSGPHNRPVRNSACPPHPVAPRNPAGPGLRPLPSRPPPHHGWGSATPETTLSSPARLPVPGPWAPRRFLYFALFQESFTRVPLMGGRASLYKERGHFRESGAACG